MSATPLKNWIAYLAVALAFTTTGCGGGDNNEPGNGSQAGDDESQDEATNGPDDTESSDSEMGNVQLAKENAAQLSRVALINLPEAQDPMALSAHFREADEGEPDQGDEQLPLLVLEETVYLVTPLYDTEGINLNVALFAHEERSPMLPLSLAPLPAPRAGAIEDLVAAIEAALQAAVVALGKDYPETLEKWRDQGFNQMPEYLVPLMQTWLMILDPENEQAMANRAYEDEERELLERVLASGNLADGLMQYASAMAEGDFPLQRVADTYGALTSTTEPVHRYSRTMPSASVGPASLVTGGHEMAGLLTIDGPDSLSQALHDFRDARRLHRDMELFDETVGAYISMVGLAATVSSGGTTGAASTTGREAVRRNGVKLLENISKGASAAGTLGAMGTWFFPCCITDVLVQTNPDGGHIAQEDSEENQFGVTSVTVNVETQGVDVAREAFDRAFSLLREAGGNVVDEDLWRGIGQAGEDWVLEETQEALLNQLLDNQLVFAWQGVDVMGYEPQHWLEHDLTTFAAAGSPIIELASPAGSPSFEFRLATPEAFERQDSFLRIWPDLDLFPQGSWSPVVRATVPVALEYIEPQLQPQVQVITEVPQTITFDVVVANALDTRVHIINEAGELVEQLSHGDTFSVEVTDPPGEDGYEISHWALSISEGGIRDQPGAPERSNTGVILVRPEGAGEDEENDEEHIPGGCMGVGEWITPEQWETIKDNQPEDTEYWLTTHINDEPVLPELRGSDWTATFYHPTDKDIWARFDATLGASTLSFEPSHSSHEGVQMGSETFTLVTSGHQEEEISSTYAQGTYKAWRYIFENSQGETIDLVASNFPELMGLPSGELVFGDGHIDSLNKACVFEFGLH